MQAYVEKLYIFYQKYGDDFIAEKQARYMRNQFLFFGLMNDRRKELWQEFQNREGKLDPSLCMAFALHCLKYPERELWYTAMQVVKEHKKMLQMKDYCHLRDIIVKSNWWDIVDIISIHGVGFLYLHYPLVRPDIDQWIYDENVWLRRAALIYQIGYKSATDEFVLYRNILLVCHEKEFFIRKAIGWALREYSKHKPESVRKFIDENRDKLAPLSIREGEKYVLNY